MPLFTLITLTFVVFLILWTSDLYFTTRSVREIGRDIEINPIIRFILRTRGRFIWPFKIAEIIIFSYLIWRLSFLNEEVTFSILMGGILFYSLVIVAGVKVFIEATKRSIPVVLIFLGICLSLFLFISLTYTEYQNKALISNALSDCNSKYALLYVQCTKNVTPIEASPTFKKYGVNLTIQR